MNDEGKPKIPFIHYGEFRELLQAFRFKIPKLDYSRRKVRICYFQSFRFKYSRKAIRYWLDQKVRRVFKAVG